MLGVICSNSNVYVRITWQGFEHNKDLTNINEDDKLLLSSNILLLVGDQMFLFVWLF